MSFENRSRRPVTFVGRVRTHGKISVPTEIFPWVRTNERLSERARVLVLLVRSNYDPKTVYDAPTTT